MAQRPSEFRGPASAEEEHETMSDQMGTDGDSGVDLRGAVQALLDEDLNDRELASRLRALLPPAEDGDSPPTTDDATDHPGYQ